MNHMMCNQLAIQVEFSWPSRVRHLVSPANERWLENGRNWLDTEPRDRCLALKRVGVARSTAKALAPVIEVASAPLGENSLHTNYCDPM
jgi:hypothetical protein